MSGEIHSGVQDVNVTVAGDSRASEDEEIQDNEILKKTQLTCEICNIKVTSTKILQRHLDGRKHKMRMERRGKSFNCDLCEIIANSETQLNIHLNSSKHKAKLLKKEYADFTDISTSRKGIWIIAFCVFCIFINLLLLFKMVL